MNNNFTLFLEKHLFSLSHPNEFIKKINSYTTFLDGLTANTVMVYAAPSFDTMCFCIALILKNKTYIPIHTSTSSELVLSYLTTFSIDLLIIDEQLASPFNSEFKKKINEESDFFYYLNKEVQTSFCWLPGIVFFTSGTTELPKVVHYHYDVIERYLHWCIQEFKLTNKDNFLFTTEFSFVASLRPLFLPLLTGAKVSFIDSQLDKINLIISHITEKHITILNSTPSLFQILVDSIKQNKLTTECASLRLILLSGEPLNDKTINYWLSTINKNTVFYNLYGATEFLVPFYKKITGVIREEERLDLGQLREGSDYKLSYVKDKGFELYITGDIATAYFNTVQTKDNYFFVEGKKYIKTNDFVKTIKKQLYFDSRNQRLIKHYGQMINLDQIEYVLRKNIPSYNFIVISDEEHENELHLFIEKQEYDEALVAAIQRVLKQHFPKYMHPHHVHFLIEFPKTSSGKIDYRSLISQVILKNDNLNDFFMRFFPNKQVDFDTPIMSLGLESIDYIDLSVFFFKKTKKWLDISLLNETTRIKDLDSCLAPLHFEKYPSKSAVKINPELAFYFLDCQREVYLTSYYCIHGEIDFKKLELAIAQTIAAHFMLSCKIVRLKDDYFFEKTEPQQSFWLKKSLFFKKRMPKLEVLMHSERLVNIYIEKKDRKNFLIIAFNHIAIDGWAALLIREEIFRRYEGSEEVYLPRNEEIAALNKINEICLPTNNTLNEFKQELLKIKPSEYTQVNSLHNGSLIEKTSCFVIPKEKIEQFKARNHLNNIPTGVLFILVFTNALLSLIKKKKLMFYITLSNRNLPIEDIQTLIISTARFLPIFYNSENKSIVECADELKKLFFLYFKSMHPPAIKGLFEQQPIDSSYFFIEKQAFPIMYTYINTINKQEYIQNKYIDWERSINHHSYDVLGAFLRVYNLNSQCAVILNSKMNEGLHDHIINYFKKVFNVRPE